jgi:intein/homing endonuclease
MDSEEVEKWDEESERAWKNDNLDVQFPETIVSTLKLILPAKAKILDAGCVTPETIVVGGDEAKSIELITNNEQLLTGKVETVFARDYEGDVIRLKPRGLPSVVFTPEHPVLIGCGKKSWISKRTNRWKRILEGLTWKPASQVTNVDYVVLPRKILSSPLSLKNRLNLDIGQLARVIGLYIGDGWVRIEKSGTIFLAYGSDEDRDNKIDAVTSLGYSISERKERRQIAFYDKSLAIELSKKIGRYAHEKRIPREMFSLSDEGKINVLKGLFESDGYYFKGKKGTKLSITTVSPTLAYDLVLLFATLGVRACLQVEPRERQSTIQGRKVNLRTRFVVTINGLQVEKFGYQLYGNVPKKICLSNENFVFVPIDEVRRERYRGKVHNLKTTDGIYLLPFIVHNCGVGKHVRAFRRLGYEVTGIDQSKKAIEYAKILNPDSTFLNIRLQQLDAVNCYDLIHTCAVLQHSKHERKIEILQRFHKALKPNGYLLCAECTFTLETLKQLKEKNPSVELSEDWTDGYSFSEKGWRRFMAANNFLHVKTIPPWPYYLFQKCEAKCFLKSGTP